MNEASKPNGRSIMPITLNAAQQSSIAAQSRRIGTYLPTFTR